MPTKTDRPPPAEGGSYVVRNGKRERVAWTRPADAPLPPAADPAEPETPTPPPAARRGRRNPVTET